MNISKKTYFITKAYYLIIFLIRFPILAQQLKAIEMFKMNIYGYINVEELMERDKEDIDEKIVEQAIVHNVKKSL